MTRVRAAGRLPWQDFRASERLISMAKKQIKKQEKQYTAFIYDDGDVRYVQGTWEYIENAVRRLNGSDLEDTLCSSYVIEGTPTVYQFKNTLQKVFVKPYVVELEKGDD
jgi:hypothetical protein